MQSAVGVSLGLAVMGGVFAEGIDLPAERLCGAATTGSSLGFGMLPLVPKARCNAAHCASSSDRPVSSLTRCSLNQVCASADQRQEPPRSVRVDVPRATPSKRAVPRSSPPG